MTVIEATLIDIGAMLSIDLCKNDAKQNSKDTKHDRVLDDPVSRKP